MQFAIWEGSQVSTNTWKRPTHITFNYTGKSMVLNIGVATIATVDAEEVVLKNEQYNLNITEDLLYSLQIPLLHPVTGASLGINTSAVDLLTILYSLTPFIVQYTSTLDQIQSEDIGIQ